MLFETSRMLIRHFTVDDQDDLFRIYGDPELMLYIREPLTKEATNTLLENQMNDYRVLPNLGRFAVFEKETESYIGLFLLRSSATVEGVEIGYAFLKEYWSRGFATELTKGGLQFAFETLKLPVVYAITHPENKASKKVLCKAGLLQEPDIADNGKMVCLFSVSHKDYKEFASDKVRWVLADLDQLDTLASVARRAYSDHYLHLWHDSGDWYMEKSFSLPVIEEEWRNANSRFFIVYANDTAIGFVKVNINAPLDEINNAMELERIYLTAEGTGKEVGGKLMKMIIDLALQNNKKVVWLKAMDSSDAAIAFYKKMGFEICGTYYLDYAMMKKEYRGMVVMKKELIIS